MGFSEIPVTCELFLTNNTLNNVEHQGIAWTGTDFLSSYIPADGNYDWVNKQYAQIFK